MYSVWHYMLLYDDSNTKINSYLDAMTLITCVLKLNEYGI